ncbi:hypothetical protein ACLESD_39170 [Pyxidicoccus sp. 3LFB2]
MKPPLLFACLLLHVLALACASAPATASALATAKLAPSSPTGGLSDAERHACRCRPQSDYRKVWPQGTMLWGTKRDWNTEKQTEARSSVLVSADLAPLRLA